MLVRHFCSWLLLTAIDVHKWIRQRCDRQVLRVVGTVLACILLATGASSIVTLYRLSSTVTALRTDALVGVEAAVGMRMALRDIRVDLIRVEAGVARSISPAKIQTFERRFDLLLGTYRDGAFTEIDRHNSADIEKSFHLFVANLRAATMEHSEQISAASYAENDLLANIDRGYEYNRDRLHQTVTEASTLVERTLIIARRLAWSFCSLLGVFVLVYLLDRLAIAAVSE